MSLATLSHSPEFDLPPYGPGYNDDVLNLIECHHEGLYRVVVSKMLGRNKYEQIAAITCQENPERKKHPAAQAQDIAEYAMMCIQHNIDETDIRGVYKIALYGPPGKGGAWTKSKHIDLRDEDADPRSISMLSEGELCEQQGAYIGELHSQIIACIETVQGVIKPLMNENKEMMKIVADSQRQLAEVEKIRLNHDLQLKIHDDETKQAEAEEERRMERWKEVLNTFKDTGAAEVLIKGLIGKLMKPGDALKSLQESKKAEKNKEQDKDKHEQKIEEEKNEKKGSETKKRKRKRKGESSEPKKEESTAEDIKEAEKKEYEEAMQRVAENPLIMAAEALKMSIDENRQWKLLYKTLSDDQASVFDDVFGATSDDEVKENIQKLIELDGLDNVLELNKQLDEQQQKFVAVLLSAIT